MRFLFITPAWSGHFLPLVAPAQRLIQSGHAVQWVTTSGTAPDFSRFGLAGSGLPAEQRTPPMEYRPDDLEYWRKYLRAKAQWVPPLRAVIREFRPDAIALDASYESQIAAHLEGVPYARLVPSLTPLAPPSFQCPLFQMFRALSADREALFEHFGVQVEFHDFHALSPWLNTVFTTRGFVGEDVVLPPRTHLVGPSLPDGARGDEPPFPWERLDAERPLVLALFGSIYEARQALVDEISGAVADVGAQLVLSVRNADALSESRPSGEIRVRYAPQLALLARAAVCITHGGANSVMEAMAFGVPVLVLPMTVDQPLQAHFVEKAGVGYSLAPQSASRSKLKLLLDGLLDPASPVRKAARRVQNSYRRSDGAAEVARLLVDR